MPRPRPLVALFSGGRQTQRTELHSGGQRCPGRHAGVEAVFGGARGCAVSAVRGVSE